MDGERVFGRDVMQGGLQITTENDIDALGGGAMMSWIWQWAEKRTLKADTDASYEDALRDLLQETWSSRHWWDEHVGGTLEECYDSIKDLFTEEIISD